MKTFIFEEHSSVLPFWWERVTHPRTLVCVDAHLDLQHVGAERIARLKACRSIENVRALEKPHCLLPDNGFSYSVEDFLYPAFRLGLIDRLIWVAPPHVRTEYSAHAIEQLQQMDGVLPEELYGFKYTDRGWIEGRLLGLDIVVCDYRHLEYIELARDSLIDIDIDYFITVPDDTPWIDPQKVFEVLHRLPVAPEFVTVSRSVNSGFTPLRFRFIADYLAALWEESRDEQEHYARLFQYEACLQAGEGQVAFDLHRELMHYQECAATWFLLSLAEKDAAEAARCRKRAGELSDAYPQNVLRTVCGLRNRTLPVDMPTVLGVEQRIATECGSDAMQLGLAWAALGLVYCCFRELQRAEACYQRASAVIGEHPELAIEIGKLLAGSGQLDRAEVFLNVALQDDNSRTGAHFFISQIKAAKGLLDDARQHLVCASEASPAWYELIDRLSQLNARLGNHAEAQGCRMRCDVQRMQAARLHRQLGLD